MSILFVSCLYPLYHVFILCFMPIFFVSCPYTLYHVHILCIMSIRIVSCPFSFYHLYILCADWHVETCGYPLLTPMKPRDSTLTNSCPSKLIFGSDFHRIQRSGGCQESAPFSSPFPLPPPPSPFLTPESSNVN